MGNQSKFITSHRTRVRRAETARKNSPEKISIFDRDAYVEFYLLEDIVHLYEYRLDTETKKNVTTRAGEMAKVRNIKKFNAIIKIFTSAIEIAWGEITSGNYKAVWSSIPEHALMVAANSLKYLPELRAIAVKMLKNLSNEALEAAKERVALDDSLDEIEDHEANYRSVKNMPSEDEIDAIIKAVEDIIPDKKAKQNRNFDDINIQ